MYIDHVSDVKMSRTVLWNTVVDIFILWLTFTRILEVHKYSINWYNCELKYRNDNSVKIGSFNCDPIFLNVNNHTE